MTWSPSGVLLSVPGSRADRFDRAAASGCDAVVLDLEDSVLPKQREAARDDVSAWLKRRVGGVPAIVRVNAVGSPWFADDVDAVVAAGARAVIVPKVAGEDDVFTAVARAAGMGAQVTGVVAIIESAAGWLALREIARSPGLVALTIGYADLAAETGRPATADWSSLRLELLLMARANGIAIVDGPALHVRGDDAFERSVRDEASGFDGKWVLHPRQIERARRGLTASPDVLDDARRVLAALDEAAITGTGVARLDGRMLDEAVAAEARRVLARGGLT